jgi:excisionase family DNA binding protein
VQASGEISVHALARLHRMSPHGPFARCARSRATPAAVPPRRVPQLSLRAANTLPHPEVLVQGPSCACRTDPRDTERGGGGVTALDNLRQAAELLPPGASVTVTREALLAAIGRAPTAPAEAPTDDLTVADLAARFQRSASTVRGWIEAGRFPGAYKLRGRDWRVSPAAVDAFREHERRRPSRGTHDLGAWRRRQRRPA